MSSLKDLQNKFQNALLTGDLTVLQEIPNSSREQNNVLLGVYRHAYSARLREILTVDYPLLHTYLGDERFYRLADDYITACPSTVKNARWFGKDLAAFIAQQEQFRLAAQISELALLEWALGAVFDERDETPITLAALAEVPPDAWPGLVFEPLVAVRRLDFATNAADIWLKLRDNEAPPKPAPLSPHQSILVFRENLQAHFRPLADEEAMMWDEMARGVRFGVLCEMVATFGGEDDASLRAATYLQGWINGGLIADLTATH